MEFNEQLARALFLLAGFDVRHVHRLENPYWPDAYVDVRQRSPWFLMMTELGAIRIGWRKRVIAIHWGEHDTTSPKLGVVTADSVTKGDDHVHAWSYAKAVEYLTALRHPDRRPGKPEPATKAQA